MAQYSKRLNDLIVSEHFRMREFECPCCHCVRLSPPLLVRLEALRAMWGRPIIVTSGYRCPEHNAWVKGAPESLHMMGQAADVVVPFEQQEAVIAMAERARFSSIIPYGKRNFIHLAVALDRGSTGALFESGRSLGAA